MRNANDWDGVVDVDVAVVAVAVNDDGVDDDDDDDDVAAIGVPVTVLVVVECDVGCVPERYDVFSETRRELKWRRCFIGKERWNDSHQGS